MTIKAAPLKDENPKIHLAPTPRNEGRSCQKRSRGLNHIALEVGDVGATLLEGNFLDFAVVFQRLQDGAGAVQEPGRAGGLPGGGGGLGSLINIVAFKAPSLPLLPAL